MRDSQKINEITDQDADVPDEWVWTKMGEVCETKSGGTPSRNNKTYYGGTIPWLKSGELKNEIINSAEESITESGLENSSTKIIPKGTLLIALYGATVGKLGILGIDAAINQAICAIYIKINNSLDQKFLFWYAAEARKRVDIMTQSILARAFRGDLSADFREAVRNWKDLDAEARGRYVFVLPEEKRERVLNGDEFPMEPASRLLERIGEEKGKISGVKTRISKGQKDK